MAYLALYRAWRPQKFSDIIGQEQITKTLQNALKDKRFSHAYLFSGPRGTGKTSAAKIFAKTVNCELGSVEEPCNECDTCKGITDGSILDVVEIDAASNRGVEEIRDLREKIKFAPTESRFKVYIIDEVHMLTPEAFNALLKTLEEPPPHVIFILATTEPHKIPLTIISRCQRFDFRRISVESMSERINFIAKAEGFTVESNALTVISRYSEGGMRDALSLLDQVVALAGDIIKLEDVLKVTGGVSNQAFAKITQSILEQNAVEVLNIISSLIQEGKEPEKLMEDLLYYYRDLLLYKTAPSLEEMKEKVMNDEAFPSIAKKYNEEHLYRIIEILNKYIHEMKNTNQSRIFLELALIKISKTFVSGENQINLHEIEELRNKINKLEKQIEKLSTTQHLEVKKVEKKVEKAETKSLLKHTSITEQLEQIKDNASEEGLQKLLQEWPKILLAVKEKKVTVHAWLLDGEPVCVTQDQIVIAFYNIMHRDTTDKANNRQIIEDIVYEYTGIKYQLLNILQKEWKQSAEKTKEKPTLNDVESEEFNHLQKSKEGDEFIKKTIEIFGENLVEIKD